jgi:hypothetical protein
MPFAVRQDIGDKRTQHSEPEILALFDFFPAFVKLPEGFRAKSPEFRLGEMKRITGECPVFA